MTAVESRHTVGPAADAAIHWEQDSQGIVVLTLDDPKHRANTMNAAFVSSLVAVVDRLYAEKATITGVILTSAKKTFFAGGDLDEILAVGPDQAQQMFDHTTLIKGQLRRLETLGKPVVAALNGSALGGGLELALACHHRIALDSPQLKVGLPEVTLGLLAGGGGVVRTVRLLGVKEALTKVLLDGKPMSAAQAVDVGIVDELASDEQDLLPKARAWITGNPDAMQPWDRKGFRIPGGDATDTAAVLTAQVRGTIRGANYPAPRAVLAAAAESARVDIDTALRLETRYFVELVTGDIAKNLIGATFIDPQQIRARAARPEVQQVPTVTRLGVIGAGMMGAGIAYVAAAAGINVVLSDLSVETADNGKNYSRRLVAKAVSRGTITRDGADALLDRISVTAELADLAGADAVIEAVFEDPHVKGITLADAEKHLGGGLLASNTSTLPITGLADSVTRPDNFIGMHFFSPVDKMPLLELVVGEKTSDEAIAKAIKLSLQLGKTPIVVNDSRGFFTSRVIEKANDEAMTMLAEGIPAASIEQAGRRAGYPAPPLQLLDELTLTLPRKARQETRAAFEADGGVWGEDPAGGVLDRMIDDFGRGGRLAGAGFYDYEDGRRVGLWPGLAEHFGRPGHTAPFEDLVERPLFIESIETIKCLDEGVLRSIADANVGSIIGIGYPRWTGGVLRYINSYPGGMGAFVARARQLAERYGPRFTPPASLVDRSERNEPYGDD